MTTEISNEDSKTMLQQDETRLSPLLNLSDAELHEKNALSIGTILEDYEIVDIIGWGGFGIVYLANDNLGRKVAIKEYMPASLAKRSNGPTVVVISKKYEETFQAGLRSFVNEARLLAQFHHPSLIEVFRFWENNGTAYMVTPFYQGKTLKEILRTLQQPPEEAWLKYLLEHLLNALSILHEVQCYHRDISPDNILILSDKKPLLLDFGAARHVINDMTHSLTVILKPGFAPIEQYGEIATMKQGAWTDIYALAAVIYLAISGKTPIPAVSRMVSDTLIPLSELASDKYSSKFLKAIETALAINPGDRPQSVNEFRDLLEINPEPLKKDTIDDQSKSLSQRKRLKQTNAYILTATTLAFAIYLLSEIVNKPQSIDSSNPISIQEEKKFTPLKALNEVFENRDLAHAVSISIEKAKVRIHKDPLQFSINSARNGYVYLLMVGTNLTDFYLLFPNNLDQQNRIESGNPLSLPRDEWKMLASGPPGINHFVIIVSDNPRDFSSAGLSDYYPFAKFPFQQAQDLYLNYDDNKALFAGTAICQENNINICSQSYGAAVFSIEEIEP